MASSVSLRVSPPKSEIDTIFFWSFLPKPLAMAENFPWPLATIIWAQTEFRFQTGKGQKVRGRQIQQDIFVVPTSFFFMKPA
jgi:hypothetical protein